MILSHVIWPNSLPNSRHSSSHFVAIYAKGALLSDKLTMETTMGILGTVISIIVVITIGAIWALVPRDRS